MSNEMGVNLNKKTCKTLLIERKPSCVWPFKNCFEDGMVVRNYLKNKIDRQG